MKKIFGIKIGGLHQKILLLVLINLIVFVLIFAALSIYQGNTLADIVGNARTQQQEAITQVSEDTMHQVIESSLTKSNSMQAYIADEMFSSVRKDVYTLQTLAESVFENRDNIEPGEVQLPDPAADGSVTAQVLYSEGVDYTKSEYLPYAAHLTGMMKAMYTSAEFSTNVYIGLNDGTHLAVDDKPSNKFDENGKIIPFPVRERPWYRQAAESGTLCFSGVMKDAYTDSVCITCSAPVYADNELIGVVGIDIFLDAMEAYVSQSLQNGGFICIIGDDGKIVFAPEGNGIFKVETFETAKDMRTSDNAGLSGFVTDALKEATGLRTVDVDGKQYYMAGTPINTVGWAAVSVIDKALTEQPTVMMLSEFDRISEEAAAAYREGSDTAGKAVLIIIICTLFVMIGGALHFAGRIVEPIESMTADIMEGGRTGKLFEMRDTYRTGDEIEVLAESFDDLSKKTKQYIIDITRITKEKERIGTELELARKIQADMLPNIYPAFPDRPEFDIYATMTPAKEVGGDFYDFFLIDDDHLGMVMADVSGKGVPAALFMMMSKILINNYAMQGGSPGKVLEQTNSAICRKNEEEMFVTVWFGILEISTGRITAANAGHEFPILRKPDGDFELFRDKHGFVIGGMAGMKFKEYEIMLEKGGTLFLYTDGVPEATNASEELFGTERLIEALNMNKEKGPRQLLPEIKKAVDDFVGEADQFDDLTMLAVTLM